MELRQLAALVTVAEVGSVTKAARLLHLVQPAVSRQIRLLEEELGVVLFERTRHGMIPTEAGRSLIERARRVLGEIERAEAEFRLDAEEISGIVTVGVLESLVDLIVEPLVAEVASRLPGVNLRIMAGFSGHLRQWIDNSDVDMSLLYNLTSNPLMAVVPLLRERLWAVAPPTANLDQETPVTWASVFEHPVVLPVPGHGLRILIDRARSEFGVSPDIAIESNSMHLQKRLVLSGCGWTVLPVSGIIGDLADGSLKGAPLIEPEVIRTVVLALRREASGSRAVQAVSNEVVRVVRAQVTSGTWPSAQLAELDHRVDDSDPASWARVAGFIAN